MKLDLNKIGLKHLFLAVLIAGAVFAVYRHYSYVHSLSPVVRAVYEQRNIFPKKESWTLDPSQVVNKFVRLGITEAEVIAFIEESGMRIGRNPYRAKSDIEEFETRIVAYQDMRSGFAGWKALLAINYELRIIFRFNEGILERVDSYFFIHTL